MERHSLYQAQQPNEDAVIVIAKVTGTLLLPAHRYSEVGCLL